jgi:hypothetical protein
MAIKYARSTGVFEDSTIWSLNSASMIPTTTPEYGDIATANGFTVTITSQAFCDVLTNNNFYSGCFIGGGFILSDNAQISASITNNGRGVVPSNINTVTYGGTLSASIISPLIRMADGNGTTITQGNAVVALTSTGTLFVSGNIVNGGSSSPSSSTQCHGIRVSGNGNLNFYGQVQGTRNVSETYQQLITKGGTGTFNFYGQIDVNTSWNRVRGVYLSNGITNLYTNIARTTGQSTHVYTTGSTTYVNVFGDVYSANNGSSIYIDGTREVTVYGNLSGNSGNEYCVRFGDNTSGGYLRVFGDVISNNRPCVYSTGNQSNTVYVSGDVINLQNHVAIQLWTDYGTVYLAGNLLSYSLQTVPIHASIMRMFPPSGNTYIQYPTLDDTFSEKYTNQYMINSLSSFSLPPVSSVRLGVVYGYNALTGTCVIPPPSSVALNVLTDNTVGQAVLSANTFFELPLQAAIEPDTFASYMKKAATVQSAGYIISSFTRK